MIFSQIMQKKIAIILPGTATPSEIYYCSEAVRKPFLRVISSIRSSGEGQKRQTAAHLQPHSPTTAPFLPTADSHWPQDIRQTVQQNTLLEEKLFASPQNTKRCQSCKKPITFCKALSIVLCRDRLRSSHTCRHIQGFASQKRTQEPSPPPAFDTQHDAETTKYQTMPYSLNCLWESASSFTCTSRQQAAGSCSIQAFSWKQSFRILSIYFLFKYLISCQQIYLSDVTPRQVNSKYLLEEKNPQFEWNTAQPHLNFCVLRTYCTTVIQQWVLLCLSDWISSHTYIWENSIFWKLPFLTVNN